MLKKIIMSSVAAAAILSSAPAYADAVFVFRHRPGLLPMQVAAVPDEDTEPELPELPAAPERMTLTLSNGWTFGCRLGIPDDQGYRNFIAARHSGTTATLYLDGVSEDGVDGIVVSFPFNATVDVGFSRPTAPSDELIVAAAANAPLALEGCVQTPSGADGFTAAVPPGLTHASLAAGGTTSATVTAVEFH